ncbi:AbrB family transcriptional regulator [Pseudomonas sp. LRF_L74]|uniref:AbrB family transcriptional regulator n=1 Tax=Pseudomonas sp. LRF_L74 TaxID=3369422 RepID=UPI003F5F9308
MPDGWRLWWPTPVVGAVGGLLASLANWPLPWMIGALVAVILFRCSTPWQIRDLPGGRKTGQWIIGIGIGLHFSPEVIEQVVAHFWPILFCALVTTLSSAAAVWLLRRTGEDAPTAFFSCMPGGSGEMVNLGLRNGAVSSRVAAAQSLRVVAVVLCVPAVFKLLMGDGPALHQQAPADWFWLAILVPLGGALAWLWQRLKQPNPWLFGPLLVSAAASIFYELHVGLPPGASQLGQLLIGGGLGCHFDRAFFRRAPSFLARTMIGTALMIGVASLCALGMGWLTALDVRSLTLGMMPGGIAEMSLTAETLQLSVPLVTALQVLRLLLVLFLAEPIYRRWRKQP